jgi:uncharacterized phage protein (TIGR02218 family)
MKSFPILLAQHYKRRSTSTTYLWLLKRELDGLMLGFTSLDRELIVDGQVYHPGGFEPTAMNNSSDMNVDGADVEGHLDERYVIDGTLDPDDVFITEEDVLGGKWDKAQVWLMRTNWRAPEEGVEIMCRGDLGEIQTTDGFRAELRGLCQALQQMVGLNCEPACNHTFGDRMCGVNKSDHTYRGSVTQASPDNDLFRDASRQEAAGAYDGGEFRWLTGANAGFRCEVKTVINGGTVLQELMPFSIAVGDTYSIVKGCNKIRDEDCLLKFDNVINHGGFADLPGRDRFSALGAGSASEDGA